MDANTFVGYVLKNRARVTEYKLGHDGTGGQCDCIGLIVGAWRLAGKSWPWTHGSNYTARYLLADGIQKNAVLHLGDLVFKGRQPGDSGYDLPTRYKSGTDLTDYYHIGVVTSVDPLVITHCTSVKGGIKIDTARGKWYYSGQFKHIEQGDDESVIRYITAANGAPVNLRQGPGTTYAIVTRIPVGTQVEELENKNDWTKIRLNEKLGWVMTKYLAEAATTIPVENVSLNLTDIKAGLESIKVQVDDILSMLGV